MECTKPGWWIFAYAHQSEKLWLRLECKAGNVNPERGATKLGPPYVTITSIRVWDMLQGRFNS